MSTNSPTEGTAQPRHREEYLTRAQLARALHLDERTLERWAAEGKPPRFIRAGRRVLYASSEVDAWLKANTFASTSEADKKVA